MEKDLRGVLSISDNNKIAVAQSLNAPEDNLLNYSINNISDQINKIFLQKLGQNKTNKILHDINTDIYNHICEIYSVDAGKLLVKIINEVCSLPYFRIVDLFNCIYCLKTLDREVIVVLTRVASLLKGENSFLKAIEIQDRYNYINDIIYNRPHFDFKAKVNCILNACKSSEGTHIIKYGNLFLNTQKDGFISIDANKGGGESRALGLFIGDMQFINQYEFKLKDRDSQNLKPEILLTENKGLYSYDEINFGKEVFASRKRVINGAFFERIELTSSKLVKAEMLLSTFIKDIFEVRGLISTNHNKPDIFCCCENGVKINKEFDSGDVYGIEISIIADGNSLLPVSSNKDICQMVYKFDLMPNTPKYLEIRIQPTLNDYPYVDGEQITNPPVNYDEALNLIKQAKKTEFAQINVESDIPNIQKTIDKSIADLGMLVSYINLNGKSYSYIDAGLPRYGALFGRDSIITALNIFPLNENIARDTLELLAYFQGLTFEDKCKQELHEIRSSSWSESAKNAAINGLKSFYLQREEAPGKILHELRVGELAKSGKIPHGPYYGTVDATPLWLILYAEYCKWSKDKNFQEKLLPHAEAALEWIKENIIDGYLRFSAAFYSKVKIQNQGWKDSGDSIRHVLNPKGYLCDPEYPIALAEVQGYVYKAYRLMSEIYADLGDPNKANSCIKEAEELKQRFNKDFWLENEQFYSMALDRNNRSIINITSNIGHCLTMGIVNNERMAAIEETIMSPRMFSGWGIRTLSSNCCAFDPLSYHNGSVWTHDTALAAMGLSKKSMSTIAKSLFEAANTFENNRLPELFSGFQRVENDNFIQEYAEACSPQAWASASIIGLLLKLIGFISHNVEINTKDPNVQKWLKSVSINIPISK